MKKTIGIPGYKYQDGSFGVGPNHLEYLSQFGNPRILMPWEEVADVDMIYLPGGLDVNPASYGEIPGYRTSNADLFKQFFFDKRLDGYIEAGIPVFGVCLGMQMLAARFGCTLLQNLLNHKNSPDRWMEAHKVHPATDRGVVVGNKVFKKGIPVNGHHHQALTVNGMSRAIEPLWITPSNEPSDESPIIEGFKIVDKPIYGVQWHPEEFYDEFSKLVITHLLESTKKVEAEKVVTI